MKQVCLIACLVCAVLISVLVPVQASSSDQVQNIMTSQGNAPGSWKSSHDLITGLNTSSPILPSLSGGWKTPGELIMARPEYQPDVKHVFTADDNGTAVDLMNGDIVQVILRENPTTGYRWNVTVSPGIRVISDTYKTDPHPAGYVGVGGNRTWTLQMKSYTTQSFTGIYKQAWMPASDDDLRFSITFNVGGWEE